MGVLARSPEWAAFPARLPAGTPNAVPGQPPRWSGTLSSPPTSLTWLGGGPSLDQRASAEYRRAGQLA